MDPVNNREKLITNEMKGNGYLGAMSDEKKRIL
jgi:hypothetical protein